MQGVKWPERCEAFHFEYRCIRDRGHTDDHKFWLDSGDFVERPNLKQGTKKT